MPSTLIPLDNLLGAALIGTTISAVIYGISCLQTYLYYTRYGREDRTFMKYLVGVLFALDSFHLALLIMMLYHYMVTNFGNYLVLTQTVWSLEVNILIGTLLTSIVQCFFAHRVFSLSGRNWYLASVIVLLSMCQIGFGIAFMKGGFDVKYFVFTYKNKAVTTTAISFDIACDTVIAASMCYYLHKSRTGFTNTNRVINLLITYAINTCLLTTICTVACLATFLTLPDTMVYSLFYFIVCRLYANSLLSTLNSRDGIRKAMHSSGNGEVINLSKLKNSTNQQMSVTAVGVESGHSQDVKDISGKWSHPYGDKEANFAGNAV